MSGQTYTLLAAVTVTGAGSATSVPTGDQIVFQADGTTSAGSGAATIKIYGSRNNSTTAGVLLGTITLTLGTTSTMDGFASEAPWSFVWAEVTAISGTTATVTVKVGV